MNIYENPNGFIRAMTILLGLVICLVSGHAQSIIFLIIGLSISTFGIAWGCLDYLIFLGDLVTKVKNSIISAIASIIKSILSK